MCGTEAQPKPPPELIEERVQQRQELARREEREVAVGVLRADVLEGTDEGRAQLATLAEAGRELLCAPPPVDRDSRAGAPRWWHVASPAFDAGAIVWQADQGSTHLGFHRRSLHPFRRKSWTACTAPSRQGSSAASL